MHASEEHFRKLERMYNTAPINDYFKPVLRVSEGRAEVTLTIRPDFFHAAHALHGSVYFKALDDASFFAASSAVRDVFIVTVSFNVVLLRAVTGGVITASGRLVHKSRNLLAAEAELVDENQKLLARGNGTFMRSTTALSAEIGYK